MICFANSATVKITQQSPMFVTSWQPQLDSRESLLCFHRYPCMRRRKRGPVSDRDVERLAVLFEGRSERLAKGDAGKMIARVDEAAEVLIKDETALQKYASAHDIRRGCALRLIDMGVSAETLKLVMQHKNLVTTEKP